MVRKEYRLEVLTRILDSGEQIWNPIGYEEIFDNFKSVNNFKIERQYEHPNNRYRIVSREVSEWNEIIK